MDTNILRSVPSNPTQRRPTLKTEAVCPISGVSINGNVVPVHRIPMAVCSNGSLFGYCSLHEARVFVKNRATVGAILKVETPVIQSKEASGG